jgi:hypothetical protein
MQQRHLSDIYRPSLATKLAIQKAKTKKKLDAIFQCCCLGTVRSLETGQEIKWEHSKCRHDQNPEHDFYCTFPFLFLLS